MIMPLSQRGDISNFARNRPTRSSINVICRIKDALDPAPVGSMEMKTFISVKIAVALVTTVREPVMCTIAAGSIFTPTP